MTRPLAIFLNIALSLIVIGCRKAEHASPSAPPLSAEQVLADSEAFHARLRSSNPDYRGNAQIANNPELGLVADLAGSGVRDLSPLAGIPFNALDLRDLPVSDLAALKGMPLKMIALEGTQVKDLRPLTGVKLEKLYLNKTPVNDLQPLAGMPLVELQLVETQVKNIEPLRGAPLEGLWLNDTAVADLAPLSKSPLVTLTLQRAPVSDLSPLSGIKSLRRLHIGETKVHDLTPLRGLPLERLIFTPSQIKTGLEAVRAMSSLQELGTTLEGKIAPDGFWRLLDAGQLK